MLRTFKSFKRLCWREIKTLKKRLWVLCYKEKKKRCKDFRNNNNKWHNKKWLKEVRNQKLQHKVDHKMRKKVHLESLMIQKKMKEWNLQWRCQWKRLKEMVLIKKNRYLLKLKSLKNKLKWMQCVWILPAFKNFY